MKFISKNSNLRIILEPGLPANALAGTAAKPTVFVRFNSGIAEVKEPDLIKKMVAHDGFNSDFIAVDENGADPFAHQREEIEPAHFISDPTDRKGQVLASKKPLKVSKEMDKLINDEVNARINKMLPGAIDQVLKQYAANKAGVELPQPKTVVQELAELELTEEPELKKKGVMDFLKGK